MFSNLINVALRFLSARKIFVLPNPSQKKKFGLAPERRKKMVEITSSTIYNIYKLNIPISSFQLTIYNLQLTIHNLQFIIYNICNLIFTIDSFQFPIHN